MKTNKIKMSLLAIGGAVALAGQAQYVCPIYAPPDPTGEAVKRLCADNARLVAQINASLPKNVPQETETQRTFRFINQVMNEKDPEKLRQMAAYWQAVGNAAEAQTQSMLRQRQSMAWEAKNRADQEFRQRTGRDFSSTMRPSTPGALQDAYDACNRVHQIWRN